MRYALMMAASLLRCFAAQTPLAHAQDFNDTVLPIRSIRPVFRPDPGFVPPLHLEAEFGTGFCLDRACRFVGTNYHVAATLKPRKIKGQKIIQRYLATSENDEDTTINDGLGKLMRYNLSRDLAIFELSRPIPHHHGVSFYLDDLERGQEVDIYVYPFSAITGSRKLCQFHGRFKGLSTRGMLAFEYTSIGGKTIRGGSSGGIIVESKSHRIVGILSQIAKDGEPIALAVSVQSLVDFVSRVQPYLAESIFPTVKNTVSMTSHDLYPRYEPPPADSLQRRVEETAQVKLLRDKAQLLADDMRNLVAVQTFAWGRGEEETAAAAYEVSIRDGIQRFRAYPDGKKILRDVPFPDLDISMVPGGEWSELPAMVGRELGLKIHQAPDANFDGRPIKVFQYWTTAEDDVCKWTSVADFIFFEISKTVKAACYGEVWTDQDTNILRISEHYELLGKWKDFQGVVNYGWLRREGELPRPIPVTFSTQAQFKNKTYWCRGQFTDYQVFSVRSRVMSTSSAAVTESNR